MQTGGDAVSARCTLQRPARVALVRITVLVGHAGRTLRFDRHPRRMSSLIVRAMILCSAG
jgi:hypothetical protein